MAELQLEQYDGTDPGALTDGEVTLKTIGTFRVNNELRGVWEMGKKYIYNLDINLNEIVITEGVSNFVDAALADIALN